jgi:hypothetical protein
MSMQRRPERGPRPKPRTPAERGEEFAADQRRMKAEAAERRNAAAAKAAAAEDAKPRGAAGADERTA